MKPRGQTVARRHMALARIGAGEVAHRVMARVVVAQPGRRLDAGPCPGVPDLAVGARRRRAEPLPCRRVEGEADMPVTTAGPQPGRGGGGPPPQPGRSDPGLFASVGGAILERFGIAFDRRAADIVEQFGDLEFGFGLCLGGKLLDRLARSLKLGLFGGAGDVDADRDLDLGVKRHRDRVQTQFLDRPVEHDGPAVDREARGGGGLGDVARRDRAIERARIGGGADQDELLAVERAGLGGGFGPGFGVARLELGLAGLESLHVGRGGAQRLVLGQQIVAREAVLDRDDLAHLAKLGHAFEKDHLHRSLLISRRRAGAPESAPA
jgi:hypothetical protein